MASKFQFILDIAHVALLELGDQHDNMIILPWGTRSTKDEAITVRTYLDKHSNIRSVILVTSDHTAAGHSGSFKGSFASWNIKYSLFQDPVITVPFRAGVGVVTGEASKPL